MRLTLKEKIKELATLKKHNVLMTGNDYKELKLGQLEDIEELCIKMTNQPIYEKFKLSNTHICKLDFIGHNTAYDFKNNCIIVYKGHSAIIYFVNDYGKTWSLDKDELTNE